MRTSGIPGIGPAFARQRFGEVRRSLGGGGDLGLGIRTATGVTLMLGLLTPLSLFAQNPADPTMRPRPANPPSPLRGSGAARPAQAGQVAVPPIECWWKTDRSAVRVGETFTLTMTCAVLDTERVKVVVDESGLAPSALHLVPFEIVGGERFRDILNAPRRFFQYQYTMRVLGEEFFGKEITLPRLQISYRVQNSLQGGSALQGREAQYSLVPVPIRVLSLVPAGAADIRDTPVDTFGDVDARLFRSNLLLIVAGVAFVLAGLMAVMLVARAAVKRHSTASARHRTVSPGSVLRAASRELGAVQAASQNGGWNSELAGRAAAAVRLAGAVALSRPVSHQEIDRDTAPTEGQVLAAPGLATLRGKRIVLSASVTPDTTARNGKGTSASDAWRSLSQTLGIFSAARYSRNGGVDGTALDAALAEGRDAVKRLRLTQWRRIRRPRRHTETTTARQTWAR
jgi:hypothetical protein